MRGDVTAIFLRRRDGTVLETLIDTSDLLVANSFSGTWTAQKDDEVRSFYVVGQSGKRKERLHRLITSCPIGMFVDHINHAPLDNRRSNLRILHPKRNAQNRVPNRSSVSGFRGVTRGTSAWVVRVQVEGSRYYIGSFANLDDAVRAAQEARRTLMPFSDEATEVGLYSV